jgi:hypothetical protein
VERCPAFGASLLTTCNHCEDVMHNHHASPITRRGRRAAALGIVAASLALGACTSPLDTSSIGGASAGGDWRSAKRCQPQENPAPGDHAGDGPALSPEEILPDRGRCPEAYVGHGGGSGAPPLTQPEPDPVGTYPRPNLDHGCADGETLNGFPCKSVPGTGKVIYPEAPGEDRDPPQIPNY